MQSKNSTVQLELFNESALPEAVTLHADRPGFFSLLVKPAASTPRQSSYRVDVLPQVLAALDPDIDVATRREGINPSEWRGPRRSLSFGVWGCRCGRSRWWSDVLIRPWRTN